MLPVDVTCLLSVTTHKLREVSAKRPFPWFISGEASGYGGGEHGPWRQAARAPFLPPRA